MSSHRHRRPNRSRTASSVAVSVGASLPTPRAFTSVGPFAGPNGTPDFSFGGWPGGAIPPMGTSIEYPGPFHFFPSGPPNAFGGPQPPLGAPPGPVPLPLTPSGDRERSNKRQRYHSDRAMTLGPPALASLPPGQIQYHDIPPHLSQGSFSATHGGPPPLGGLPHMVNGLPVSQPLAPTHPGQPGSAPLPSPARTWPGDQRGSISSFPHAMVTLRTPAAVNAAAQLARHGSQSSITVISPSGVPIGTAPPRRTITNPGLVQVHGRNVSIQQRQGPPPKAILGGPGGKTFEQLRGPPPDSFLSNSTGGANLNLPATPTVNGNAGPAPASSECNAYTFTTVASNGAHPLSPTSQLPPWTEAQALGPDELKHMGNVVAVALPPARYSPPDSPIAHTQAYEGSEVQHRGHGMNGYVNGSPNGSGSDGGEHNDDENSNGNDVERHSDDGSTNTDARDGESPRTDTDDVYDRPLPADTAPKPWPERVSRKVAFPWPVRSLPLPADIPLPLSPTDIPLPVSPTENDVIAAESVLSPPPVSLGLGGMGMGVVGEWCPTAVTMNGLGPEGGKSEIPTGSGETGSHRRGWDVVVSVPFQGSWDNLKPPGSNLTDSPRASTAYETALDSPPSFTPAFTAREYPPTGSTVSPRQSISVIEEEGDVDHRHSSDVEQDAQIVTLPSIGVTDGSGTEGAQDPESASTPTRRVYAAAGITSNPLLTRSLGGMLKSNHDRHNVNVSSIKSAPSLTASPMGSPYRKDNTLAGLHITTGSGTGTPGTGTARVDKSGNTAHQQRLRHGASDNALSSLSPLGAVPIEEGDEAAFVLEEVVDSPLQMSTDDGMEVEELAGSPSQGKTGDFDHGVVEEPGASGLLVDSDGHDNELPSISPASALHGLQPLDEDKYQATPISRHKRPLSEAESLYRGEFQTSRGFLSGLQLRSDYDVDHAARPHATGSPTRATPSTATPRQSALFTSGEEGADGDGEGDRYLAGDYGMPLEGDDELRLSDDDAASTSFVTEAGTPEKSQPTLEYPDTEDNEDAASPSRHFPSRREHLAPTDTHDVPESVHEGSTGLDPVMEERESNAWSTHASPVHSAVVTFVNRMPPSGSATPNSQVVMVHHQPTDSEPLSVFTFGPPSNPPSVSAYSPYLTLNISPRSVAEPSFVPITHRAATMPPSNPVKSGGALGLYTDSQPTKQHQPTRSQQLRATAKDFTPQDFNPIDSRLQSSTAFPPRSTAKSFELKRSEMFRPTGSLDVTRMPMGGLDLAGAAPTSRGFEVSGYPAPVETGASPSGATTIHNNLPPSNVPQTSTFGGNQSFMLHPAHLISSHMSQASHMMHASHMNPVAHMIQPGHIMQPQLMSTVPMIPPAHLMQPRRLNPIPIMAPKTPRPSPGKLGQTLRDGGIFAQSPAKDDMFLGRLASPAQPSVYLQCSPGRTQSVLTQSPPKMMIPPGKDYLLSPGKDYLLSPGKDYLLSPGKDNLSPRPSPSRSPARSLAQSSTRSPGTPRRNLHVRSSPTRPAQSQMAEWGATQPTPMMPYRNAASPRLDAVGQSTSSVDEQNSVDDSERKTPRNRIHTAKRASQNSHLPRGWVGDTPHMSNTPIDESVMIHPSQPIRARDSHPLSSPQRAAGELHDPHSEDMSLLPMLPTALPTGISATSLALPGSGDTFPTIVALPSDGGPTTPHVPSQALRRHNAENGLYTSYSPIVLPSNVGTPVPFIFGEPHDFTPAFTHSSPMRPSPSMLGPLQNTSLTHMSPLQSSSVVDQYDGVDDDKTDNTKDSEKLREWTFPKTGNSMSTPAIHAHSYTGNSGEGLLKPQGKLSGIDATATGNALNMQNMQTIQAWQSWRSPHPASTSVLHACQSSPEPFVTLSRVTSAEFPLRDGPSRHAVNVVNHSPAINPLLYQSPILNRASTASNQSSCTAAHDRPHEPEEATGAMLEVIETLRMVEDQVGQIKLDVGQLMLDSNHNHSDESVVDIVRDTLESVRKQLKQTSLIEGVSSTLTSHTDLLQQIMTKIEEETSEETNASSPPNHPDGVRNAEEMVAAMLTGQHAMMEKFSQLVDGIAADLRAATDALNDAHVESHAAKMDHRRGQQLIELQEQVGEEMTRTHIAQKQVAALQSKCEELEHRARDKELEDVWRALIRADVAAATASLAKVASEEESARHQLAELREHVAAQSNNLQSTVDALKWERDAANSLAEERHKEIIALQSQAAQFQQGIFERLGGIEIGVESARLAKMDKLENEVDRFRSEVMTLTQDKAELRVQLTQALADIQLEHERASRLGDAEAASRKTLELQLKGEKARTTFLETKVQKLETQVHDANQHLDVWRTSALEQRMRAEQGAVHVLALQSENYHWREFALGADRDRLQRWLATQPFQGLPVASPVELTGPVAGTASPHVRRESISTTKAVTASPAASPLRQGVPLAQSQPQPEGHPYTYPYPRQAYSAFQRSNSPGPSASTPMRTATLPAMSPPAGDGSQSLPTSPRRRVSAPLNVPVIIETQATG